jgi:hypothetical protein
MAMSNSETMNGRELYRLLFERGACMLKSHYILQQVRMSGQVVGKIVRN